MEIGSGPYFFAGSADKKLFSPFVMCRFMSANFLQTVYYHIIKSNLVPWKMVLKFSPCYIYNITEYFESELFYRDGPFIINVPFVGTREKCYIFKIGEQSL